MSEADLLRIGEAAKLLGVHEETVRRWEAAGIIEAIRMPPPDGQRRFRRVDVLALIEQGAAS